MNDSDGKLDATQNKAEPATGAKPEGGAGKTEPNVSGESSPDGAQQNATQDNQTKANNWTTSLPKEYREAAAGYGSLKGLLDATLGKKQTEQLEKQKTQAQRENWDDYLTSLGEAGSMENNPTLHFLKDSGLDVEHAKQVVEKISSHNAKLFEDTKKNLGANMAKLWGKDYETNSAALDRGLAAIGNKQVVHDMFASGQMYNPFTLHLVALLGRNTTEAAPPAGKTPVTNRETIDPRNPYGFK